MITIFGIGSAGKNIASLFREHKNYNIVTFTTQEESEVEEHIRLEPGSTPEQCEDNIPDLSACKTAISDHIQVILCGSSFSANYALGILEQVRDRRYFKKPSDVKRHAKQAAIRRQKRNVLKQKAKEARRERNS